MVRVDLNTKGSTNFEKALNMNPVLKRLYDELYNQLWNESNIHEIEKEKIRLYLANINGCSTCMSLTYVNNIKLNDQITEAMMAKDFSGFSEFDLLLFSFVKKYRSNPREISDNDILSLKEYFNDRELIELMALINLFDGFHKMIVSLDLYDFCTLGGK